MTFFQLSVNCLPQFTDTSSLVSEWHNKCHPTVLVNMSTNVILTLDQCFSQLTTNTSALKFKPGFVLTLISISFTLYQVATCLVGIMIHDCYLLTWILLSKQTQEQEKLGKLITNVNMMTSQLELHYFEDADNEIVVRAREMSEMVSEMYLFTRYALHF